MLTRTMKMQLAAFATIATVAGAIMIFGYIKAPANLLGIGRYTVTVELPRAAGLYATGNVTYRGTEVGRVTDVRLTTSGAEAVLSLRSDQPIPSDLDAEVHSQTAIGEQYVALLPRTGNGATLKNGDVIPLDRTKVPPEADALFDDANTALQAIPHDNLRTMIDESYVAFGGLGPELSRIIKGSTKLAIDIRADRDSLTTLVDQAAPVLDSQTNSADAIQQWAANVATITGELKERDPSMAGLLHNGGPATAEVRELVDRLQLSVPLLLANLASVGDVALTYNASIEQVLVLLPQAVATVQGAIMPNLNTKQDYKGIYMDFNLNLNLPPPCTTGYLPAQQMRSPVLVDAPERPPGDLYCRIPQDSMFAARGARNYPCIERPGKRAATAKLCESDEPYVPLNDGLNWKGDPNATLSGQAVPQLPPVPNALGQTPPPTDSPPVPTPAPLPVIPYDPATGTYVGPDGHTYTQGNLADSGTTGQTWQSMLMPPTN